MSHNYLRFPAAPNLPLAPLDWNSRYQDQFANVLRLYFNQLSGALLQLARGGGGYHLSFPHGAFRQNLSTTLSSGITNVSTTPISVASTEGYPSSGYILIESEIIEYTNKTATAFGGTITRGALGTSASAHLAGVAVTEAQGTGSPTTIGTVIFNDTNYNDGIKASADYTKIIFLYPGIYNLQISAQLLNFTTSEDNVTLWFRKNGNDVVASASIQQVNSKHGSFPGTSVLSFGILLDMSPNDYVQIAWTSNTGNTVLATYPAGTSPIHPSSAGLTFTAMFVSSQND